MVGRELLGGGGPGQGDRRTDRRRKGREEENERGQSRAEQNTGLLEQTARARVDEWGTERDWGGWEDGGTGMDGWIMGLGWDDCLWGERDGGVWADGQWQLFRAAQARRE